MTKNEDPFQEKTHPQEKEDHHYHPQKKRTQRGWGVDIQKWLAKTGIEFHWPGYQYMGPGTHLAKQLKRGDPDINRLDKIAKLHDIDYRSCPEFARQVESPYQDDQSHRSFTRQENHDRTCGEKNHASQETFEIVHKSLLLLLFTKK